MEGIMRGKPIPISKSMKFIPGYLDAQAKMEEAFKQAQVKGDQPGRR